MAIVGFDFTKIDAEKKSLVKGKIKINNNVSIKKVEGIDLSLGKEKKNSLKFSFEFSCKYEPELGFINLNGDVIYMEEANKVKEILDYWKKEKKLPKEVSNVVLNTILSRSNIKALIISQDINLPSPIPMPKVQMDK